MRLYASGGWGRAGFGHSRRRGVKVPIVVKNVFFILTTYFCSKESKSVAKAIPEQILVCIPLVPKLLFSLFLVLFFTSGPLRARNSPTFADCPEQKLTSSFLQHTSKTQGSFFILFSRQSQYKL